MALHDNSPLHQGTSFTGEFADLLVSIAADVEAPSAPATPASEVVSDGAPDVMALDLSRHIVAGRLKEWWLAQAESQQAEFDPDCVIGCTVRNSAGKTSPITGVDPRSQRILTRSGSVYQLSVPELKFAARGRHVLRRMGF